MSINVHSTMSVSPDGEKFFGQEDSLQDVEEERYDIAYILKIVQDLLDLEEYYFDKDKKVKKKIVVKLIFTILGKLVPKKNCGDVISGIIADLDEYSSLNLLDMKTSSNSNKKIIEEEFLYLLGLVLSVVDLEEKDKDSGSRSYNDDDINIDKSSKSFRSCREMGKLNLIKGLRMNPLGTSRMSAQMCWTRLGELYFDAGDLEKAKQCFERGIEFTGESPLLCRNLSIVLRKNGGGSGGNGSSNTSTSSSSPPKTELTDIITDQQGDGGLNKSPDRLNRSATVAATESSTDSTDRLADEHDFRPISEILKEFRLGSKGDEGSSSSSSMITKNAKNGSSNVITDFLAEFPAIHDSSSLSDFESRALGMAKRSVQLDPTDCLNWECLGNSYLGIFGKKNDTLSLKKAIKAFDRAKETDQSNKKYQNKSPTLYWSLGQVSKFSENLAYCYENLEICERIGGYQTASVEKIKILEVLKYIDKFYNWTQSKIIKPSKIKSLSTKLTELASGKDMSISKEIDPKNTSITKKDTKDDTKDDTKVQKDTTKPTNSKALVLAKVLYLMEPSLIDCPIILICLDQSEQVFILSIYGTDLSALQRKVSPLISSGMSNSNNTGGNNSSMTSTIELKNFQITTLKGFAVSNADLPLKPLTYPCLRIDSPKNITIISSSGRENLGNLAVSIQ